MKPFVTLRHRGIALRSRHHLDISILVEIGVGTLTELREAQKPGSCDIRLRCALRAAQSAGWWVRQGFLLPWDLTGRSTMRAHMVPFIANEIDRQEYRRIFDLSMKDESAVARMREISALLNGVEL